MANRERDQRGCSSPDTGNSSVARGHSSDVRVEVGAGQDLIDRVSMPGSARRGVDTVSTHGGQVRVEGHASSDVIGVVARANAAGRAR